MKVNSSASFKGFPVVYCALNFKIDFLDLGLECLL